MIYSVTFLKVLTLMLFHPSTNEGYGVDGQVTAFLEIPLEGVEVVARKSKKKVKTDANGFFHITVNKSDVLLIHADGFQSYRKKITRRGMDPLHINLILNINEQSVNKAIEQGYLTEDEFNYAKKNLFNNNNKFARYADIYELIQAELPGVRVIKNGAPGGEAQIIINGVNSIELDSTPIFVVDGLVVEEISFIAPSMIKQINIIKDASFYGSRGANGAIEIVTLQNN